MNLEIPIENFTRISSAYQTRLKNLGILTMRDLIYHFPFRYQDFSARTNIADLEVAKPPASKGKFKA